MSPEFLIESVVQLFPPNDFNFGQISIAISALDHELCKGWVKHELIGKLGVSLE